MTQIPRLRRWPQPLAAGMLCATGLSLPAPAQEATVLDPITVEQGAGETPISGGVGYIAGQTATGVKAGVPLTEVPMSVSVVTQQELVDRSPTQVEEALNYLPGITSSVWGVDDRFDQFLIRGFDVGPTGVFRDSLPNKVLNFSGFTIEPFMIERIDVLRGPSSVLYGEIDAAGMINIISKRPKFERFTEAMASYGSHDTAQIGLDTGDSNAAGTLAWRFTGLARDGANQIDGSEDDRNLLALGVTWAPSDATSVTFLTNWQKDNLTPNSFLPVAGEDYDIAAGPLPDSFVFSQSDYNKLETEQFSFGWQAQHQHSDALRFVQNARYAQQSTDYNQLYFAGMVDDQTMDFAAFAVPEDASILALDNQAIYTSQIGGVENTLLVGLDLSLQEVDGTAAWESGYLIDVTAPSYDFPVVDPAVYQDQKSTVGQAGLYIQDHAVFSNGLTITGGLRQSWVENTTEDNLTGTTDSQYDTPLTGMLGATYDLGNGVVPYASYTQSFNTNIGTTYDGAQFEPTRGEQVEVGVRYSPTSDMMLSAAVYDLTKSNVLTADPDNEGYNVQTGEIRHRGIELEARGNLTEEISILAAYSYIDSEILQSNDGDQGNENYLVPNQQASLWGQYDFAGLLDGLGLGAGVRYVGESWGDTANTRSVDDYVIADLALRYAWDGFIARLGVTNLFDEQYYATCDAYFGCILGEGRETTLTLSKAF